METGIVCGVLGEHPGCLLGDIEIDGVDELLHGDDAGGEVERDDRGVGLIGDLGQLRAQDLLGSGEVGRGREPALAVLVHHRRGTRGQVAQTVCELGGVPRRHVLPGERAILPEGDRPQEVVAEGI